MMKTIILATLSIIGVAVIGLSAHKIMEQESQITNLELKNKELLNRNRILEKQLLRERTRLDDLYVGKYCPVCRSDSIRRIKYGIEGCSCVVYDWSKRFLCNECEYRWGIEVKLMDCTTNRHSNLQGWCRTEDWLHDPENAVGEEVRFILYNEMGITYNR